MIGFLRGLLPNPEADQLLGIASDYRAVCAEQRDIILQLKRDLHMQELEHSRWARSIVEKVLYLQDNPEIDVRDILMDALRDLDDQVARLEEHAPA